MVCSNWAVNLWSLVTTVQSSGEQFYRCFAGIDHGFDGECHAGLEHNTGAGPSVVQDLGFVMKNCANAVGRNTLEPPKSDCALHGLESRGLYHPDARRV